MTPIVPALVLPRSEEQDGGEGRSYDFTVTVSVPGATDAQRGLELEVCPSGRRARLVVLASSTVLEHGGSEPSRLAVAFALGRS